MPCVKKNRFPPISLQWTAIDLKNETISPGFLWNWQHPRERTTCILLSHITRILSRLGYVAFTFCPGNTTDRYRPSISLGPKTACFSKPLPSFLTSQLPPQHMRSNCSRYTRWNHLIVYPQKTTSYHLTSGMIK